MKSIILVSSLLFSFLLKAQNFFLYEGGKFQSSKISLVSITADTVTIKMFFPSSERCACEPSEIFKLSKNDKGDFFIHPNDDEEKFIQANVYDGKVQSICIKSDYMMCCDLIGGIYLAKPTPPSGSTVTPKLQMLNAAPKRFLDYWTDFQSHLNTKDSIISFISFPYGIDCNYLYDVTSVTEQDFNENGIDVFVNGNAFISNTFSSMNYPKNKGLYFGLFMGGYMSENIKSFITNKYGDLENIYIVSELPNFEQGSGYKAYFRETNGSFKFIGFEGIEQGD